MPFTPPGPAALRSPARFLWWLVVSQRGRIAAGATLGTLWTVGLTLPPYLLSRAVDDGLRAHDTGALLGWTGALLAAGALNAALSIWRHRTMTRVRLDAAVRTVRATVHQATGLGDALRRHTAAGEVVTIGMSDVYVAADTMTVTGPGVGSVIGYAVVAVLLLSISPLLAVVVLAGVPLVALTVGPLQRRLRHAGAAYRQQQGELTGLLVDVVGGLRVLGGLGGKDVYARRYAERSRALRDQGYQVGAATSWVGALATGLPALFLALVTWLGARMAAQGTIRIGDLVAVYGYTAMLVVPVGFFIEGTIDLARGLVAARRIVAFLSLTPRHQDRARPVPAPGGPAVLADPASEVVVVPGAFTALAAARPADAAAVLDRLARFTPSAAAWGPVPLADVPLAEVRARVLLADNDAALFGTTLREAVTGRPAPDPADDGGAAVRAAIRVAVADDVVAAMPGGLEGRLTARAANLSGGQRQRLRLARAVHAAPEVLLAVEPTSAVDALTEAEMAVRLRAAREGLTTVVATTSPLVLEHADTVLHLVDGRVAAAGPHRELLRTAPAYRALVARDTGADEEAPR
ncbi:ABC transporter transmembrane domain-containing protein [Actinacidiphila rubida]|uniref:ABC transporter transmembrane domain-containing protein n=1 Tax=Actinacidiphila rubida TaxID=310780 RepID=UPI000942F3AC|nr:ABC transporter ATP-binding protein [Actinacidiphila rubida]